MKYIQQVVATTTISIPASGAYTGVAEAIDVGSAKQLILAGLFLANSQAVTLSVPSLR
ncbi:MAG: hypothetical protein VX346_07890 [Planctomycetota bacterium]|nr:hypothetical protein [Planctomycetota bacterium]